MSQQRNIHATLKKYKWYNFGYTYGSNKYRPLRLFTIDENGKLIDISNKKNGNTYVVQLNLYSEIGVKALTRNYKKANFPVQIALFPNLVQVDVSGMEAAFEGVESIKQIQFPKLETVEDFGLQHAFKDCINLGVKESPTNSNAHIYFPKLRQIGRNGLYHIFSNTKVKTVHFSGKMKAEWESVLTPEYLGLSPLKVLDEEGNETDEFSGEWIDGKWVSEQQVFFDADLMWNYPYENDSPNSLLMWTYVKDENDVIIVDEQGNKITEEIWGNRYKG